MKIEDFSEEIKEELEKLGEAEDDDDEDSMEADLCEAKELLEASVEMFESLIRNQTGRRNAVREKEMEDLAVEITGFLNQWESEDIDVTIEDLQDWRR